jgi:hypothetical protein
LRHQLLNIWLLLVVERAEMQHLTVVGLVVVAVLADTEQQQATV